MAFLRLIFLICETDDNIVVMMNNEVPYIKAVSIMLSMYEDTQSVATHNLPVSLLLNIKFLGRLLPHLLGPLRLNLQNLSLRVLYTPHGVSSCRV